MDHLLLALACLHPTNNSCQPTADTYFATHAEVRELLDRQRRLIDATLPPVILQYVGPAALIAVNRSTAIFRLTRYTSLQYSVEKLTVNYGVSF